MYNVVVSIINMIPLVLMLSQITLPSYNSYFSQINYLLDYNTNLSNKICPQILCSYFEEDSTVKNFIVVPLSS